MPHVFETYKERAAPAVENHSLSGEDDEAESLGSFVRCRARGPQTGTPAAKRLVAIRRLRAGQDGGLAGLRRLERDGACRKRTISVRILCGLVRHCASGDHVQCHWSHEGLSHR
jgi:hypothetical protein